LIRSATPLFGFCAYGSGVGKTTLLTQLIPALTLAGLKISVIKHAHHHFDIDHPGKDSYRLREAGAVQMLIGSNQRWALMTELARTNQDRAETSLDDLLAVIDTRLADLIIVEGFRDEAIPKIEVFRPSLGYPLLASSDTHIMAVASDEVIKTHLPVLNLNNPRTIADFILHWLKEETS
jgi:molybdopterin-guanine dinucleotide biosynthesis protein B